MKPLHQFRFQAILQCAAIALATTSFVAGADDATSPLPAFLKKHCVECHGPDEAERGLRFDQLKHDFAAKESAPKWIRVLELLRSGEMPPADAGQPSETERKSTTAWLQSQLHAASLAQQRADGRVAIRRLNRTEYETTLSDLLGMQVNVRDLLPEDNSAAGFDNISSALDVSAAHLLRYQEAAERACRAVIPTRPPVKIDDRRTGRQVTEKFKPFADLLDKYVKLEDESLIMYARSYGHIPCSTATVPQTGRYRVRAQVRALNTEKRMPVLLSVREQYGRDDNDIRGVFDVSPNAPLIIDGEFQLPGRQMMVFTPWSLPDIRTFQQTHKLTSLDGFAGPAIAIDWVEVTGPLDVWPSVGYQQLFGGVSLKAMSVVKAEVAGRPIPKVEGRDAGAWIYDPLVISSDNPKQDAERLLKRFLPRAFRRPVTDEQIAYFTSIAHTALATGDSFPDAMILAYKSALCSPHFLFLTQRTTTDNQLDDYALASRLSYFLWSSLPDDELLACAARGELTRPEILRVQTERLLQDPKAQRFTQNFAGQWLELRNINATSPDPQLYGEFDSALFWAMPQETELFFKEILHRNRSVAEFTHSNWTFLNERLAQHYGIAGVEGGQMRRVALQADSHRGGVLTQASILKVTADGTKTSPIMRGKWVLERIIGQPPAPPPPDIPAVEPDIRGATTIRQLLEKHRSTAACNSCHKTIDPPGFALEAFDVIGGFREYYRVPRSQTRIPLANYPGRTIARGLAVELGGETADGRKFTTVDDYKQLLLADKDQLARNIVQKLIVYGTGADVQFADRAVIDEIVAESRPHDYGFRTLLHGVVQSRLFHHK